MAEVKGPAPEEGVNVNVILRCRPANTQELAERAPQVIQCNEALREVTLYQSVGGKQMSRTFRYDKVFGPDSKQERVYKQAIVPIVQEVLDGFNCTIFAYGQTGTGKTFTMEGGPRNSVDGQNLSAEAGVIPRAIKQIFDAIECNQVTDSSVKVSFMELYNEELTDLLSPGDDKDKRLRLLEDRSGVVVQGLEEMVVKNAAEIYQVLDRGTSKRRTAETLLNKRSSRSHSVFTITIHMKETTAEGEDVIKIGKLNLVDLAGSENISRSGAKDNRAREAGNINQSLLTLGRVITALVEHSGHVPYRDSKLTRLLRDSLGGKTKTCIIATIGPSVVCAEETVSTLDYAHRAKNIRNRPELNQRISKTTMIKELTTEIDRLKLDLIATREKNGIYISTERYEASELERAQLREAVMKHKAEVEVLVTEHTEEVTALTASHDAEVMALSRHKVELEQQLEEASSQLAQAQVTIQEGRFVILSHQRAEQAISAHATQLTDDLHDTAAELADVFGKLQANLQLQQGDRSTLQGACDLVASKLTKLQSSLATSAQAQGQMLQGMQAQVQQFKQRKEAEFAQLQDELAQMQANISSTEQLLSQVLGKHAKTATTVLTETSSTAAAAAHGVHKTMQAASDAISAALTGITASLQAQSSRLSNFSQQQRSAVEAAQQTVAAGFTRARDSVLSISSSVKGLSSMSDKANTAANDKLATFAAAFEMSLAAKQEQLLAQVGSLLAGFVQDRQEAVAGMVAGMSQQLQLGRQQVAAAAAEVAAAADGCAATLQAGTATSQKQAAALGTCLDSVLTQVAGDLTSTCSSTQAVAEHAKQQAADMDDKLQQQIQVVSQVASEGAETVAAQGQSVTQQLALAAQQLQNGRRALFTSVDASYKADAALASTLSSAANSTSLEVSDAVIKHADQLAYVVSSITADTKQQLSKQPPALPDQKQPDVPPVELVGRLCCPPELVLVEHFRVQREQVLQRGGDPVEVFGLLAPAAVDHNTDGINNQHDTAQQSENEAPAAVSPAGSVRSAKSSSTGEAGAGGRRSRIPTLGGARAGLSDRTNVG